MCIHTYIHLLENCSIHFYAFCRTVISPTCYIFTSIEIVHLYAQKYEGSCFVADCCPFTFNNGTRYVGICVYIMLLYMYYICTFVYTCINHLIITYGCT